MLIVAPLLVGLFGIIIEKIMLCWLYKLYKLYDLLNGSTDIGFMVLPNYHAWVVLASLVVCFSTLFLIEKTKLGAYLRAGY